jgi:RNA polymerase sigma factor FliA
MDIRMENLQLLPEPGSYTNRHLVEVSDVSIHHTQALTDAGIAAYLIDHNSRYHEELDSVPIVDSETVQFGVHLNNGALEIRARWEEPTQTALYQEWRWTVREGETQAGFLLGYDVDDEYKLTADQSRLIESLVAPETTTSGYRHPDGSGELIDLQALRQYYVAKRYPISYPTYAPRPNMSAQETLDHYLPGLPEDQAGSLIATAKLLRKLLEEPLEEKYHRLMALLTQSRRAVKDMSEPPRNEITEQLNEVLGLYLQSCRPRIAYMAKKYDNEASALRIDDLISEGQIGLMTVLERFDLSSRDQFWTYADLRVRGAMVDSIREKANLITIPRSAFSLQKRLSEDPELLTKMSKEERQEAEEELARFAIVKATSLDQSLEDREGRETIMNIVEDENLGQILEGIEQKDVKTEVELLMQRLPHKLAEVIRMYHGLEPYDESYTLAIIGDQLGVTESRVSQLYTKAVRQLRTELGL